MSSYRFKSGSRHQFNASSEAFFHAPAHLTEGTAGPPEGYFPPARLCGVGEQEGGDPGRQETAPYGSVGGCRARNVPGRSRLCAGVRPDRPGLYPTPAPTPREAIREVPKLPGIGRSARKRAVAPRTHGRRPRLPPLHACSTPTGTGTVRGVAAPKAVWSGPNVSGFGHGTWPCQF